MEIAIKTGDEVMCEYTGERTRVLVRLEGDPADAGGPKTGWMSRKALEDALRVIGSLDGVQAAAPGPQAAPQGPAWGTQGLAEGIPPPAAPPPRPAPPAPPPVNIEAVQNFDRELVQAIRKAEQEEPEDGKKKGLREIQIREMVAKHKPVFGSSGSQAMFRVLNIRLGMEKARFDILWNQKPERVIEGVEEE